MNNSTFILVQMGKQNMLTHVKYYSSVPSGARPCAEIVDVRSDEIRNNLQTKLGKNFFIVQ